MIKKYKKVCENCGCDFRSKRPHARFCPKTAKKNCRWDHWNRLNPRITNKESVSAR